MGYVQYIGAQNPHSEEVNIAGYQNFMLDVTPSEVLQLPDAVCSYLVGVEANWWVVANGWSPPPSGPSTGSIVTESSAYTIPTPPNQVVLANTSSASFAVTLPDATLNAGQSITVKNIGTGTATVTAEGAQTIDGNATVALSAAQAVELISDGTSNWRILGAPSSGGSGASLVPTAVKTANYSAAVSDAVPADISGGSWTLTMPTAPADKTLVAAKVIAIAPGNALTVAAGGSAVFDAPGGSATATLVELSQAKVWQYDAALAVWFPFTGDRSLAQADARAGRGLSVLTPIWLTPVQWCLMNTDNGNYQLGSSYVFAPGGSTPIGDTITAGSNGTLAIDGSGGSINGGAVPAVAVGDRVVVSDSYAHGTGSTPHPEGVYVVTSVGSGGSKWVLTRATDCNTLATLFRHWAVPVVNGAVFGGGWVGVGYLSGANGQNQTYVSGTTFLRLSVCAMGGLAWGAGSTAMNGSAAALGGQSTASGTNSVASGNTAVASGVTAHALGPYSTASGQQSVALGFDSIAAALNTTSIGAAAGPFVNGSTAFASGSISAAGDAQHEISCLYGQTTTATPLSLLSNLSQGLKFYNSSLSPSYTRTMLVTITIVGRRTDTPGTDSAWTVQGVLRGNGSNAYTWVGGTTPTPTLVAQDAGASAWAVALSLSTNQLLVTVTGAASETIKWNAVVQIDQVTG